jgi:RNA polymerase sigma-70 factor, ECF subfamily
LVVALNRAIALGEVRGPAAALALLDDLDFDLDGYHLFHAARADLLRRLGRPGDATKAYARAADLATSDAERAFLARLRAALGTGLFEQVTARND